MVTASRVDAVLVGDHLPELTGNKSSNEQVIIKY